MMNNKLMFRKEFALMMLIALFLTCCSESKRHDILNTTQRRHDSVLHVRDSLEANFADSLNNLLLRADSLSKTRGYDSALKLCDIVLGRDTGSAQAWLQKGIIYQRKKKYTEALGACATAIVLDRLSGRAWFERAKCYIQLKQKQEAVFDLKQAMELHYPGADSLHEKINPLKKRVVGSHTVCCDGTTSRSSGSGTCSHHGGVCGTEYEYESYREFK